MVKKKNSILIDTLVWSLDLAQYLKWVWNEWICDEWHGWVKL